MKKMNKLKYILSLSAIGIILAGCSTSPDTTSETSQPAGDTTLIKISGSTSVAPLMKDIQEKYKDVNPNVEIEIQETGSSSGIESAINGASDIGMSSRDIKAEEIAKGLVPVNIAVDALSVIVNEANPVQNLTSEEITKIFKGEITNWSEVGGNDAEIIVFSREEGSGARKSFDETMGIEVKDEEGNTKNYIYQEAIFEKSAGAIRENIRTSENAIGYIPMPLVGEGLTAVSIDDVVPNEENVKNGTYKLIHNFILITMAEATGENKNLIDYILSPEGQAVVEESGYIGIK